MPPSCSDEGWFFVSTNDIDKQADAAARKRQDRKEVFEEGVGSKWVAKGPEDFLEVSWEDALLPVKCQEEALEGEQQSTESTEDKSDAKATVLHPPTESPWGGLVYQPNRKKNDMARQPLKEKDVQQRMNTGGRGARKR